jgi:hypothetical protein
MAEIGDDDFYADVADLIARFELFETPEKMKKALDCVKATLKKKEREQAMKAILVRPLQMSCFFPRVILRRRLPS